MVGSSSGNDPIVELAYIRLWRLLSLEEGRRSPFDEADVGLRLRGMPSLLARASFFLALSVIAFGSGFDGEGDCCNAELER